MAVRIKEGEKPLIAGDGIDISENNVISVLLREANNLIHVNGDRELYVDLQLDDGITPSDEFPVGVTTGRILQEDGWQASGTILNIKTTSGDYFRLILANDGTLYLDPGTGIWQEIGSGGGGTECNTKTFYLPLDTVWGEPQDLSVIQQAFNRYKSGKNAILWWNGQQFLFHEDWNAFDNKRLDFWSTEIREVEWQGVHGYSVLSTDKLKVYYTGNTITRVELKQAEDSTKSVTSGFLSATVTYPNAFIPTQPSHPTSKKYVDDNDTYVGGSAPTDPYQGQLWYDTINDQLKSYDGTNWNVIGSGGSGGGDVYGPNGAVQGHVAIFDDNTGKVIADGGELPEGIIKSATAPQNPTEGMVWYDTTNDVLNYYDGSNWITLGSGGGGTGESYVAGDNIVFTSTSTMDTQGPCPAGWHIPTKAEVDALITLMVQTGYNLNYEGNLLLPFAGKCDTSDLSTLIDQGINGYYRTATYDSNGNAYLWDVANGTVSTGTVIGAFIRPFADNIVPDITDPDWTNISYGLYHNSTLGAIALTQNFTDWIVIADKNLGATSVFQTGATLDMQNCGLVHQRGNNHGIDRYGNSLSYLNYSYADVDASAYGPGNYYDVDMLYLISSGNWDNSENPNLWGGVTIRTNHTVINADYSIATSTDKGVIKLGSDTIQTESAQSPSSASGRTFPVQLDANGHAVVNVPGGGGGVNVINATSSTMAGFSTKNATTTSGNYTPTAGDFIALKFTNGNTANDIKISIDNTSIYDVLIGGANTGSNFQLATGSVVLLYFDGSNYIAYSTRDTDTKYTAGNGINIDSNNQITNTLPGATVSSSAPSSPREGDLWYDTTNDILKTYDGTNWNVTSNFPGMTILSYGSSTWNDFITAYNNKAIVYCRASSNVDPSSGTQGRMAFMAYVNDATTPTEVEFQYYRSRSSHNTDANQVDEVYVYKLNNQGTWTVTVRNSATKISAGFGLESSYAGGIMTIKSKSNVKAWNIDTTYDDQTQTYPYITSALLEEIVVWLVQAGTTRLESDAILKDRNTGDIFNLVKYVPAGVGGNPARLEFLGTKRVTYPGTSQGVTGDYTHGYMRLFTIYISIVGGQLSYSCSLDKSTDTETITNYLSVEGSGYTQAFIPTLDHQPTTKKYVDDRTSDASTTVKGVVKLGSDSAQSTLPQAVSSTLGRTYSVQNDINGRMCVNVPWDVSSGDAGTAYVIKVSNTVPPSGTANNIITLVL